MYIYIYIYIYVYIYIYIYMTRAATISSIVRAFPHLVPGTYAASPIAVATRTFQCGGTYLIQAT